MYSDFAFLRDLSGISSRSVKIFWLFSIKEALNREDLILNNTQREMMNLRGGQCKTRTCDLLGVSETL